jgi:hypothetical protein
MLIYVIADYNELNSIFLKTYINEDKDELYA